MSEEKITQRSEADAELEREIRNERKFTLAEAIGRLAGPGAMKGEGKGQAGAGKEQVRAVQEALKDRGMYDGAVDGIMGPKTQAGLRAFQKKENLQETGRLDQQTMGRLGVQNTGATDSTSPAASGSSSAPAKDSTKP